MSIDGKVLMSLVMLAIFAGMVLVAAGYPPEARLLPFVIGIPGVVLCLVQLVSEILAAQKDRPEAEHSAGQRVSLRREVALIAWFVGLVLSILLFGFLVAAPLIVFAFLYFDQRESLRLSAAMALSGATVLYLVFEVLLELILFQGLLADWVFA
ncbi:MAG: tripartite tricarboxylate transporter TctB family protein [Kiloniellaceae bacterium]